MTSFFVDVHELDLVFRKKLQHASEDVVTELLDLRHIFHFQAVAQQVAPDSECNCDLRNPCSALRTFEVIVFLA